MPAATKYLGGNVSDGSSNLSVAHGSSLGDDFSGAAGVYILATPTDGPDNNENSGIWFLDLPSGPGLVLPVLPDSWLYEGWVVIDGTPVSSGRFSAVDTPDLDVPYSGGN